MTHDLLEKAKSAKSPEELLNFARDNGMQNFTDESARIYFDLMNKSGELSDLELENASGGGCAVKKGDRKVVAAINSCDHFRCAVCNTGSFDSKRRESYYSEEHFPIGCDIHHNSCDFCYYMSYEKGLWLCNNERHNRE